MSLASLPLNFWLVGQESAVAQRKGRYTAASVRHPGKMLPHLARALVREYTRPGQWILDPLSGIGTTGVEAVHLGRHYLGIELEERWAALQRENLAWAREQGARGRGTVLTADARRLGRGLPGPSRDLAGPDQGAKPRQIAEPGQVDAVITSPPYGDRLRSVRTPSRPMERLIQAGKIRRDVIPATYGVRPGNLGNLPDAEYLAGIREVYAGCYAVLKPGGLLILVVRPGRDRSRLRPLHHDTARLCQELGFEFLDERLALLSRILAVPGESPRIFAHSLLFKRLAVAHLSAAGHPVSLEQVEYVLVFRKPDGSSGSPGAPRRPKSGLSAALEEGVGRRASLKHLGPSTAISTRTQRTPSRPRAQLACRL